MRKLGKVFLGMGIALMAASCSLFDVEVETSFSAPLRIVVDEAAAKMATGGYPFSASTTIDPEDNADIQEYADKIVDIGVDGVVGEVTQVSKEGVSILAGSVLTISNSEVSATYPLKEDWPVEVGSVLTMSDLGGFYDDLSAILLNFEEIFTVDMTGSSSEQGVTISVKIDVKCTVTGNPF